MAKLTKEQVQEFIKRVEELIALQNLTKAEFYEKAGYTDAAYSQQVTGQTTPSARSINKTANALGVEATYLITGESIKKAEGYFTLGNLFLFTFLCLCAEVKGNHHQHDVVYVIGVNVARNGEIAPNSDNGKCDDGFHFDKVCKVFKHIICSFQGLRACD